MSRPLTPREREVLRLTAEGLTDPEIAARLHVCPKTVQTHQEHLREKLGVKNRVQLARRAWLEPALTAKE